MAEIPTNRVLPAPRRLLVRGVNWLGDAVMTTPALFRLREALPETRITLLTAGKLADLWLGHPAVDDVLTLASGEGPRRVGRRLREGRFDAALILPNSLRSVFECVFARIPVRVGYARSWRGWWLTHCVAERSGVVRMRKPSVAEIRFRVGSGEGRRVEAPFRPPPEAHHSHEYLALAAAFGASLAPVTPRVWVGEGEKESARAKFGMGRSEVWLGLNPGAEYGPAKRWPAERFSEVARGVSAATAGEGVRVRWVVLGGGNDRGVAAAIGAAVPGVVDLAGRTTLRELMAVLSECRLLLTNDTGPMHVAAALGVPVVVPFGSTSPELTGPGLPGDSCHRWVRVEAACAPCFRRECPIDFRCMLGIGAGRVMAEVLGMLKLGADRKWGGGVTGS